MKSVGVCEAQPVTAEGFRYILNRCSDLEFLQSAKSLIEAAKMVREAPPDILVIDKGLGAHAVMSWITELREAQTPVSIVVWGNSISQPEALRLLQSGVQGIISKNTEPDSVLACLRAVSRGTSWMEESLFRDAPRPGRCHHAELTPREAQVLELVEQGLKNKEIARELGIRPGTVKIHLKHIFEKTGVRGRYGLALSGMIDKGLLPLPRV
jgi:DNA-binding NarL/FixJ family response regulator